MNFIESHCGHNKIETHCVVSVVFLSRSREFAIHGDSPQVILPAFLCKRTHTHAHRGNAVTHRNVRFHRMRHSQRKCENEFDISVTKIMFDRYKIM